MVCIGKNTETEGLTAIAIRATLRLRAARITARVNADSTFTAGQGNTRIRLPFSAVNPSLSHSSGLLSQRKMRMCCHELQCIEQAKSNKSLHETIA